MENKLNANIEAIIQSRADDLERVAYGLKLIVQGERLSDSIDPTVIMLTLRCTLNDLEQVFGQFKDTITSQRSYAKQEQMSKNQQR